MAESPQLYLVWSYDRIFVKPIPRYLLSRAFWEYLRTNDKLHKASAGFLRTYSYLIRYETDFNLARSDALRLIPSDDGTGKPITFERFARFIAPFAELRDSEVNPRYQYGELRLTRLNLCARLFLGRLSFHSVDAQWSSSLGHLFAPMLSTFAVLSVILSAMQVALAADDESSSSNGWAVFSDVSRWFSVATIIFSAFGVLVLFLVVVFMAVHDFWFARRVLRWNRKLGGAAVKDYKTAIV